jgi:amino acid transporter
LIVLILDAAILIQGGQGGTASLNALPFTWASFLSGSVAIALLFNFASFIGFEATTIYSEEARDPKRTVPRATYVAVLTIGIFYTVTTYLVVEGQGTVGLQEYLAGLQPDPTAFLFVLGQTYIGSVLTTVMSLLFISSVFAALLAFHNRWRVTCTPSAEKGLSRRNLAAPTQSTSVLTPARLASRCWPSS